MKIFFSNFFLSTVSIFFLISFVRAFSFAPSFSEVIFFDLFVFFISSCLFFLVFRSKRGGWNFALGALIALIIQFFPSSFDGIDAKVFYFQRSAYLYNENGCLISSPNVVVAGVGGVKTLLVNFSSQGRIVSAREYSIVRSIPPRYIHSKLINLRGEISGLYGVVKCDDKARDL